MASIAPLRVAVAVRHRLLREGIQRLLQDAGFEIVGAADPAEAASLVRSSVPDVLLLGVGEPVSATLEVLEQVVHAAPSVKVLLAAEETSVKTPTGSAVAGASGVLASDARPDLLARAVAAVGRGERWNSSASAHRP